MKCSEETLKKITLVILILNSVLLALRIAVLLLSAKKYKESKEAIIESEAEETEEEI